MDLAKDPCARASFKTQPARSIEPFASEGGVRSEPELLFLAYQKIDGVVSSAGIFRKIHYGSSDLPQRGIMR